MTGEDDMNKNAVSKPASDYASSKMGAEHTFRILLVEDSLGDELMAIRALDGAHVRHKLETLRTGHQVLPYLEECVRNREILPDVIMLDLGMPGVDGFSVLEFLGSASSTFRDIPIILTTGFEHVEYLSQSGPLKIIGQITKPCTKEKIAELFEKLRSEER